MLRLQYSDPPSGPVVLWHDQPDGPRYAGLAHQRADGRWSVRVTPAGVHPVADVDLLEVVDVADQVDAVLALLCCGDLIGADRDPTATGRGT